LLAYNVVNVFIDIRVVSVQVCISLLCVTAAVREAGDSERQQDRDSNGAST